MIQNIRAFCSWVKALSVEFFTWKSLRLVGRSRVVKSAYFWFFFVPVAARVLAPIAGEYVFVLPAPGDGETIVRIDVDIPFSWKLFYLASFFFMICQAIYSIRCPRLIKRYTDFGDYWNRHESQYQLFDELRQLFAVLDSESILALVKRNNWIRDDGSFQKLRVAKKDVMVEELLDQVYNQASRASKGAQDRRTFFRWSMTEVFEDTAELAASMNGKSRIVCAWSFVVGCMFVLAVAIQCTLWTTRFMFGL